MKTKKDKRKFLHDDFEHLINSLSSKYLNAESNHVNNPSGYICLNSTNDYMTEVYGSVMVEWCDYSHTNIKGKTIKNGPWDSIEISDSFIDFWEEVNTEMDEYLSNFEESKITEIELISESVYNYHPKFIIFYTYEDGYDCEYMYNFEDWKQ